MSRQASLSKNNNNNKNPRKHNDSNNKNIIAPMSIPATLIKPSKSQ